MLPCRGPRPGGDVICGGARARLESRDSRLGAGSEPVELAMLLGSNRARLESRDLRLGSGSEPAERALLLGNNRARLESRDLRLGAGSEPAELDGALSLFTPG